MLGVPFVAVSHRSGPIGDVGRHDGSKRGQRTLAKIRDRAAMVIGVSDEIDAEIAELGVPPQRRAVIRNGVDTERFAPLDAQAKSALRCELGLSGDPMVVFTGRLMPEKRVDLLLRLWSELEQARGATLVIVGTGDEEGRLRAMQTEGVVFTGSVQDVAPYLRSADIFVLPSTAEGLSNALLEAQASGLACIVTDVGAARAVVDDGRNGMVVDPTSDEQLAEALRSLLTDAALRSRLGEAARAQAVDNFSIAATVRGFLDVYRTIWGRS